MVAIVSHVKNKYETNKQKPRRKIIHLFLSTQQILALPGYFLNAGHSDSSKQSRWRSPFHEVKILIGRQKLDEGTNSYIKISSYSNKEKRTLKTSIKMFICKVSENFHLGELLKCIWPGL